jgi:hypothetical protein
MASLRELNLQSTAVTDAAIKSVLTLTGLRKVDLFDDPHVSVTRLRDLRALPSLRELVFKVEDDSIYRTLQRTLPGVAVKR